MPVLAQVLLVVYNCLDIALVIRCRITLAIIFSKMSDYLVPDLESIILFQQIPVH